MRREEEMKESITGTLALDASVLIDLLMLSNRGVHNEIIPGKINLTRSYARAKISVFIF